MKTIEERVKLAAEGYDANRYSAGFYAGYMEGAERVKK